MLRIIFVIATLARGLSRGVNTDNSCFTLPLLNFRSNVEGIGGAKITLCTADKGIWPLQSEGLQKCTADYCRYLLLSVRFFSWLLPPDTALLRCFFHWLLPLCMASFFFVAATMRCSYSIVLLFVAAFMSCFFFVLFLLVAATRAPLLVL